MLQTWRGADDGRKPFYSLFRGRALKKRAFGQLGLGSWILWLGVLLLVGCSSNQRLHEFQTIAALGSDYAQAVEGALVRTGHLAIQANSLEMLANRELVEISRQDLERQDEALSSLINELTLLRRQAVALNDYFVALGSLSGSRAPAQYAAGLNQSASSLASVATSLKAGSRTDLSKMAGRLDAAAAVGEIAIQKKRAKKLEEELRSRHQIVEAVLELQEELLAALIEISESNQKRVAQATYEGKVAGPFVDSTEPMACAPLWLADREAALLSTPIREQLGLVVDATRNLRETWKKLVDGELSGIELPLLGKSVADALAGPVGIPPSPPPSYWHCPSLIHSATGE